MVVVTTKDRIKKILAEVYGVEPSDFTDDMNLSDEFGYDSLDILDMMFRLENEFDIGDLQDSFKNKVPQTIKDIVSVIQVRLSEKDPIS
jgi:acyl carrier protein